MATHTLGPTPTTVHWGCLDAKIPPRLTINSGDTVTIDTVSGGLADVGDTSIMLPHHREICEKLKPSPGPHILTGPVAVRGAEPGDTLEIRIKAMQLMVDWSWNLIRPLRGTLPEDYPEFRCRIIPIDRKAMTCKLQWGTTIPLSPFFGIMAVAPPPNYGPCTSVEPREFGGNLDCKEFVVGTSLYLPVFVPGANFSCGDGHAVQGDGEVCLTALETCLTGTFEFVVHKKKLHMPRAVTPTHYLTIGLDPDLDDAAKQALRDMINWLVEMKGWSSEEAYVFCSLACDLRVTQLVDGNKGIHAMVDRKLLQ
ncbi:MAG: amidase [Rhizobiales bacterium]|nr:amidase [Hyphomicrobiales bacterium]